MKERPILFNGAMVRAILDGRKTQTRRIVKPQPQMVTDRSIKPWSGDQKSLLELLQQTGRNCPHGQPGDRLWVRESMLFDPDQGWRYSADGCDVIDEGYGKSNQRCPSIHMPRSCSRINLEITSVRVERLQDISEADAKAEGFSPCFSNDGDQIESAAGVFLHEWWSIYGEDSVRANPWVWVIEFRRIEA
ncbi:MAG: hypothetical protein H6R01_1042 [Burkholderiaceae bacterium]|nr:hypothetical protein [Burkholderiaceae bacterium]